MPFKYAYVVPIFQGVLYPVTFSFTYIVAAYINKDIPSVFPYISDTGAWSIERCIFSFMLGIGSVAMFLTIYIRYRQVKLILGTHKNNGYRPLLHSLNNFSFYMGIIIGLSVFLLGCFQVQPFIVMHLVGAVTACITSGSYLVIQTYLSYKIYPALGSKNLNIFRLIVVVILIISTIISGSFGLISLLLFTGDDITQWTESSGGYLFHLISAATEWIVVLGVVFYLSLYAAEFKTLVFNKPKVDIINV
ncbi:unnamed protein product [Ceutorhynchus assimilis]|uniref:CWH43-like N-terminal domain-containing protein n=1 Tax=Ceutorhynchus assimilis TaxID=467358 RepID=A0A9N9QQ46_9CUCU|nr:unnamed protein product [Ceutorhynchus assimilis]